MKIKIGFFSILLFLSLLLTHSYFALAATVSVLLHEMGHIAAARLLNIRLKECKIGIYGAGLCPDNHIYSYKEEIALCLAGPLVNITLILVFFPLYILHKNEFFLYIVASSAVLGALNLLPIQSFDGGRILYCLICHFINQQTAIRVQRTVSFAIIFTVWCLSVYVLLTAGWGLSLFIFSLSIFSRFFVKEY